MSKKLFASLFIFTLLAGAVFSSILVPEAAAGIVIPPATGLPDPADTTGQGPVVQVTVNVMKWILSVFTLLAVMAFVFTGIKYLTSMGDTYKAEEARKSLEYSVIGVAVVGGALILIYTVDVLLR